LGFFRNEKLQVFKNGQPAIRSNAANIQRTKANASGSITTAIGVRLPASHRFNNVSNKFAGLKI